MTAKPWKAIHTAQAPKAIGAYSQAAKIGNTVYISGQIPLDPITMTVVPGDFKAQADQTLKNLSAVVEASGASLDHIVKLTVYITDFVNFPILNELMAEYFNQPYPARAVIGVASLPKNVLVEIEAILCG